MCPQWGDQGVFIREPERAKRTVTTDQIKQFIDDIAPFRPYIYFSGGEPLMNKDIIELVEHASSRHLVTSLNTNGTYLREKAEGLIRAGLDYLYTSLDAPTDPSNNDIRKDTRGGGSYADAVAAIRHVARLRDELGIGLPIIQTQTTLVKENQYTLLEMARFVQDVLGVDMWGIGLCVHTTPELDAKTTETFRREFDQEQVHWSGFVRSFEGMDYPAIERQLDELRSRRWGFMLRLYKPLGMPGFDLRRYYEHPDEDATTEPMTCMNPYVFAQMQPNGDLAFCGSQPDYVMGNIADDRFLNLWRGERAARWRRFLKNELFASCKRCWSLYEFHHFKG